MIKALVAVAKAYLRDWQQFNEQRRTEDELRLALKGVPLGDPDRLGYAFEGDVVKDIDAALTIADGYGMEWLGKNESGKYIMRLGQVMAVVNGGHDVLVNGIVGEGATLNEAVCRCLIAAHKAGVL
jgi:hypothetical protein